jgi:PH domain
MSNTNPNYGHSKILSNLIHAMNHSSSSSSSHTMNGRGASSGQEPILQGYLYKIHKRNSNKTQKYFVIFDDAPDKPGTGRLEYFDSEHKFKKAMIKNNGGITSEKRSIILCTCFNINRRFNTKFKNVIGLFRRDDTFSIMAKDDAECNLWLKQMLILQRGKEFVDADQPRPTFGE